MKLKQKEIGYGYGWQLEDGTMCQWAEASRMQLGFDSTRPSPGAKAIPIVIISRQNFKRLTKGKKQT